MQGELRGGEGRVARSVGSAGWFLRRVSNDRFYVVLSAEQAANNQRKW